MLVRPDTRSELLRSKLSRESGVGSQFCTVCLGFGSPHLPISLLGIFGAVIGLATLAPTSGGVASLVAFIVPALVDIFHGAATGFWMLNPFHMMGVAGVLGSEFAAPAAGSWILDPIVGQEHYA